MCEICGAMDAVLNPVKISNGYSARTRRVCDDCANKFKI